MYRPALFAAALAVASAPVGAAVVYSQTPYKLVGATSDFSVDVGLNQQADNFQLTSASTIRGISFWGDRGALTPDDMFIIRIFADITDKPNTTPAFRILISRSNPHPHRGVHRRESGIRLLREPRLALRVERIHYLLLVDRQQHREYRPLELVATERHRGQQTLASGRGRERHRRMERDNQ
jgi:hypothetical protein